MDVAIATDSSATELDGDNALLLDRLLERGLDARPVVWDDPEFDWTTTRFCLIRSTFDYIDHLDRFLAWADRVATLTCLFNPPAALRWNAHKRYLTELESSGIPVVPTHVVEMGGRAKLGELLAKWGASGLVVKPAVSASGRATFRVLPDDLAEGQARFEALLAERDVLVQPFMDGVGRDGEISIVYLGGTYSHAVRLRATAGEFRVQSEWGGSVERVRPRTSELLIADRVLEAGPRDHLYARVDLLTDAEGELRLNEFELIEPCLNLSFCPAAARRLAELVISRLGEPGALSAEGSA